MNIWRNPEFSQELITYVAITLLMLLVSAVLSLSPTLLLVLSGLLYTAAHHFFGYRRYRKIRSLEQLLDRILHGTAAVLVSDTKVTTPAQMVSDTNGGILDDTIEDTKEGELSILRSEILKMTIKLKEQQDRLLADKKVLADAIADIFHQIRTPLTSLNLQVSLLSEENLSYHERLRLTRSLKRQLSRISWLIESLLKMSKIDAGTVTFTQETVAAAPILSRAVDPFRIPAELKDVEIVMEDHAATGGATGSTAATGGATCSEAVAGSHLTGDPDWLVEAFSNLIKNCLEHTEPGGRILISLDENALYSEVIVRDTGSGFIPEDIPYLFHRFYKGKNATEESIGIGLALTQAIITGQNGTIKADNHPDGGARFTVRFYKSVI